MIKFILTGAAGRMGKTNLRVFHEDGEMAIMGAVEVPGNPLIGRDIGEIALLGKLNVALADNINNCDPDADLIIDFTFPDALKGHVDFAVRTKTAMVVGTTGLMEKEIAILKEAAKTIPIVWAPNFSVGINLLKKLSVIAAEVLKEGFDIEIIEGHHRMKKDSPSGTAKLLLNAVKEVLKTDDVIYGREGMIGERPSKQIGVHAIRGGDIVGDHTMLFAGIGERIELTHKASTREIFSRGALRAAKFVTKKENGLYSMEDVLNL